MSGESITIVAGSSLKLLAIVDKKQSVITWEFNTMGYDISFGIAKNEDPPKSRLEYLSPLLSYSPDKVHSGSLTINEPGAYLLVWDNSHSWLREKIISYKVTVRKLERSVDEISSFSKYLLYFTLNRRRVYNTLCNEEDQLLRTTDCIQAKVSEKEALEERLSLLLQQVQGEKESASSQEEMISRKKEETKAIESQREVLQQHADCDE